MTANGWHSLFGRIFLANALVFALGTAALALSPATVSARVLASEAVVLGVGLASLLVTNALLLRAGLAPLDRLAREMAHVDVTRPGQRLPVEGVEPVAGLVRTFNDMVDRLELERATSNGKALAAQEAERHRIARELHDEIGQTLTVLLLDLQRLRAKAPGTLAPSVEEAQATARGAVDEVREIARRLRPGVLEDLGLHSALAGLTTDFAERSGVTVRRVVGLGTPALNAETELVVYRVAQESLTNIARHASAESVELSFSKQGSRVVLEVVDDGRGIGSAAPGAGLNGMRERAMLVGGELDIGPSPHGGTKVRLSVPWGTTHG